MVIVVFNILGVENRCAEILLLAHFNHKLSLRITIMGIFNEAKRN